MSSESNRSNWSRQSSVTWSNESTEELADRGKKDTGADGAKAPNRGKKDTGADRAKTPNRGKKIPGSDEANGAIAALEAKVTEQAEKIAELEAAATALPEDDIDLDLEPEVVMEDDKLE